MGLRLYEVVSDDGSIALGLFDATGSVLEDSRIEQEIQSNWEDEDYLETLGIVRVFANQIIVDF